MASNTLDWAPAGAAASATAVLDQGDALPIGRTEKPRHEAKAGRQGDEREPLEGAAGRAGRLRTVDAQLAQQRFLIFGRVHARVSLG